MTDKIASLTEAYKQGVNFFPEKSRLEMGHHEVAFHCDKFNTRIIKGLEDVLGVDGAKDILVSTAEQSTYEMLDDFFHSEKFKEDFSSLTPMERLQTIFEIFKVLGYGAVNVEELGDGTARFSSKSSYLSEGWLENMARWNWKMREEPVCHDLCGYLQGAMAIALDKPAGSFSVKENQCRAAGKEICEFSAEGK